VTTNNQGRVSLTNVTIRKTFIYIAVLLFFLAAKFSENVVCFFFFFCVSTRKTLESQKDSGQKWLGSNR